MSSATKQIQQALEKATAQFTDEHVVVTLTTPGDKSHGDYACNVALVLFSFPFVKQQHPQIKSPVELAEKIVEELKKDKSLGSIIERTEVAKPGFINFFLTEEYLLNNLQTILNSNTYGNSEVNKGKEVVVEYSSPNIAKPFTVGHLRSTIIGDAIANLLEATGYTVHRDNHLGDWGTQFGKQIYAIKTWGNEEEIEKSDRPVKMLVDLYVKFHEEAEKNPELEEEGRKWFKRLEDGDGEAKRLWQKCVDWSLKEFKKIYEELGISFTENNRIGYGEAFFEDKMVPVVDELIQKKLLVEDNGAKLVFFADEKYPPLMIIKKDGATLYSTRDLATDKYRKEIHGEDIKIINEVGMEQSLYFKQLYETEYLLGWFKEGQRVHVSHGHYRFKEGKMSTRKGNVIWLEDILEEAKKRAAVLAKENLDNKTAEMVAYGAIKWSDLKRSSHQDIVFDWDDVLNMEGNSGPYLQYTYARTQSVLRKGESAKGKGESTKENSLNASRLTLHPEEESLLRALYHFPEVVGEAAVRLSPNIVCIYLFELAQSFNLFYQKHQIISSEVGKVGEVREVDDGVQNFRLALTEGVGKTLKQGLNLLGIQSPERM